MTTTFMADGILGRAAVWTGNDDAPWSSPNSHINRVKIHSDLEMTGVVSVRTGSINLYTLPVGPTTLLAHGLGYAPLALGWLTINGNVVPLVGSVTVSFGNDNFKSFTLGSNQTSIVLNSMFLKAGNGSNLIANYTIYLFDVGVMPSGGFRRPEKVRGLEFDAVNGTRVGYIDSNKRYLHKVSTGGLPVPRGKTISTGVGINPLPGRYMTVGFRQSVNGYVCQRTATPVGSFSGNDQAHNANIIKVNI